MILLLQSPEINPNLTMLLMRSVIYLVLKPPDAFIISLTTPVGPAAFPILIIIYNICIVFYNTIL